MKFKVYYVKNLKMSLEKTAAQVGHVMKELGRKCASSPEGDTCIVLGVSQTKFDNLIAEAVSMNRPIHVQVDSGRTEVVAGTRTAFGIIEEE